MDRERSKERRAQLILDEMKQRPQWVVWGVEKNNIKIPYDPRSMKRAKAGRPETWATYEQAWACVDAGKAQGVGFELLAESGICAVDLDHVIQGGTISDEAAAILEMLGGFVEVSQSQEGLHVFVECSPAFVAKKTRRKLDEAQGLEMYTQDRYIAMTFKQLAAGESIEGGAEAVYQTYLAEERKEPPTQPQNIDSGISEWLSKDRALAAFWNGSGRTGDESASDLALMNKLAYWCNCSIAKMVELFQLSPYYHTKDEQHKKKAERSDYLERTARKAVADCSSTATADSEAFWRDKQRQPQTWGEVEPIASEKEKVEQFLSKHCRRC